MKIFPAIDIYEGQAVRLYKGDYSRMTVYDDDPARLAAAFQEKGAEFLHMVDLEGAKTGLTPNLETVRRIVSSTRMFTQLGGGIRSMETIETYLDIGVDRVILGTAAIKEEGFAAKAVERFGAGHIAVSVDIRDGLVAIKGWTETTEITWADFCAKMEEDGVRTVICTDISKDGAMKGTNLDLYRQMKERFSLDVIASGGVSSPEDVKALSKMEIYGAILGKAIYTKAVDLREAVRLAGADQLPGEERDIDN